MSPYTKSIFEKISQTYIYCFHLVTINLNPTNVLPFMTPSNARYIKQRWPIESYTRLLLKPSNRSLKGDLSMTVTLVVSIKVLMLAYYA
jgi:hypothetical protein